MRERALLSKSHCYFLIFVRRASVANSRRYSAIGRAGVPQKRTPFPRTTFLLGMPHCAPRIAPCSTRTWSAIPTCPPRSEEHTSELQSRVDLVCRLLLEKKNNNKIPPTIFMMIISTTHQQI